MKKYNLLPVAILQISFFLSIDQGYAQSAYLDSLKMELNKSSNDTTRLLLLGKIANGMRELSPDSALLYAERVHKLSIEMKLKMEEAYSLSEMGYALINMANYPRSLTSLLGALAILQNPETEKSALPKKYLTVDEHSPRDLPPRGQRLSLLGRVYQDLGILYTNAGDQAKAFNYMKLAAEMAEEAENEKLLCITYSTLGRSYLALGKNDSALYYLQKAIYFANKSGYSRYKGSILLNLGHIYSALGDSDMAKKYYNEARVVSTQTKYYRGIVAGCLYLADLSKKAGEADSVLYYINLGLPVANNLKNPDLLLRCYTALADFYKRKNINDSTVKYLSRIIEINNSQFSAKRVQEFQNIDFNQRQQQLEIEAAQADYRAQLRIYSLLAGLLIVISIAIFIWRNSVQRKKSNVLLSKQKSSLEIALANLTRTQNQLIQSEKMASLGELTAGIAHEIQNPLNFVNNFSEVNSELIAEMNDELVKGNIEGAKKIAKDIDDNEKKIIFHGKRADSIVKGMLQHSRASSEKKEPTDINALADEYFRLAYHGLRAKDKTFNAIMKTDFDPTAGMVSVIPQDVGRVVLNLITNAFYAVTEKSAALKGSGKTDYEPRVTVSTRKKNEKIEIRVHDNGNGIPESIQSKIFQPFFTTKPTGKGTGLGLSMSYDIITKGHGGELNVESKPDLGTTFIIILPY